MSKQTIVQLVAKHGPGHADDIARGVEMCERVWDFSRDKRAAFRAFCLKQYVPRGKKRQQLMSRLDEFHHLLAGSLGAVLKVARAGQDMADLPELAVDQVLGAFAPRCHLLEDYRRFKIAAVVQLNFGTDETGAPRTRAGWAARRLSRVGREVIPAELSAQYASAAGAVDRFISGYNLHLNNIEFGDKRVRFPKGTRLIAHWGLRDYMMSLNGGRNALVRQQAIMGLMRQVVDGEVPAELLDDPQVSWDVPRGRIRRAGQKSWRKVSGQGALRWEKFRKVWQAQRAIDPYTRHGNLIDNKFLDEREMPEEMVVGMLTDVLASPLAERVACFMRDQLGRELQPFDIYHCDFESDGPGKAPLPYDIRKRYPTAAALNDAIVEILVSLGWRKKRAQWIRDRIRVDNGRSAGHAWPPQHEHDLQLLRVRVDKGGCDELNFETFMHELGHCVEGVLSSYEMDYKILWGVPNTAFTEGFAFTFQDRTDQVLGRGSEKQGAAADRQMLMRFWEPFEIGGAALTEIRFFHWLYDNPDATARQMMRAMRKIGDGVWQEFYARILGPDGHGLLSVYSHILWGDFYLAEYPVGYLIGHQVRRHLQGKSLPREMERMCALGEIGPQSWMRAAIGQKISVKPLLDDTDAALVRLGY